MRSWQFGSAESHTADHYEPLDSTGRLVKVGDVVAHVSNPGRLYLVIEVSLAGGILLKNCKKEVVLLSDFTVVEHRGEIPPYATDGEGCQLSAGHVVRPGRPEETKE